jgi:ABC-type Na+ efflux pump permease subunit
VALTGLSALAAYPAFAAVALLSRAVAPSLEIGAVPSSARELTLLALLTVAVAAGALMTAALRLAARARRAREHAAARAARASRTD